MGRSGIERGFQLGDRCIGAVEQMCDKWWASNGEIKILFDLGEGGNGLIESNLPTLEGGR